MQVIGDFRDSLAKTGPKLSRHVAPITSRIESRLPELTQAIPQCAHHREALSVIVIRLQSARPTVVIYVAALGTCAVVAAAAIARWRSSTVNFQVLSPSRARPVQVSRPAQPRPRAPFGFVAGDPGLHALTRDPHRLGDMGFRPASLIPAHHQQPAMESRTGITVDTRTSGGWWT